MAGHRGANPSQQRERSHLDLSAVQAFYFLIGFANLHFKVYKILLETLKMTSL